MSGLCEKLGVPVLQRRECCKSVWADDGLLKDGQLYVVPYTATKDYVEIVETIKLKNQ